MYEDIKVKKRIDWKSLLLRSGILLIGVFVVCALIFTPKNKTLADTPLKANTRVLLKAGKEYYNNDKLPSNLSEETGITLMELVENNLIEAKEFNSLNCDFNQSYVGIRKVDKKEYSIKANLVCSNEKSVIVDTINTSEDLSKVNSTKTTIIE